MYKHLCSCDVIHCIEDGTLCVRIVCDNKIIYTRQAMPLCVIQNSHWALKIRNCMQITASCMYQISHDDATRQSNQALYDSSLLRRQVVIPVEINCRHAYQRTNWHKICDRTTILALNSKSPEDSQRQFCDTRTQYMHQTRRNDTVMRKFQTDSLKAQRVMPSIR